MKTKISFIVIAFVVSCSSLLKSQEPCITNAWNAYNSGKYIDAIKLADQCIEDFGRSALKIQHRLDSLKITPEIGSVSDNQKSRIFQNGLLNDVSTVCFIKGRSAEYLYKKDSKKYSEYKKIATDAYNQACRYKKGRCWDPKGWFWSPCQASSKRLPIE